MLRWIFLFAYDVKTVYTFRPEVLEFAVSKSQDLAPISSQAIEWTTEFFSGKSGIMGYKCATSPEVPKHLTKAFAVTLKFATSDRIVLAPQTFRNIPLQKWLLHRNLNLKGNKIYNFRIRVRPILEHCSLVCSNRRQCDSVDRKLPLCPCQSLDWILHKHEQHGTLRVTAFRSSVALPHNSESDTLL